MEYECDFLEPWREGRTVWNGPYIHSPSRGRIWLVFGVLEFERRESVSGGAYYESTRDLLALNATVRFASGHVWKD